MRRKATWLAMAAMLLASLASAQDLTMRAHWSPPDSTLGYHEDIGGGTTVWVPPQPQQDGSLSHYNVFMRLDGGEITQVATVPSPYSMDDPVSVTLPVPLGQQVEVCVSAVDIHDREGPPSEWSDPLTVLPGVPGQPTTPRILEVYLNGS